MRSLLLALLGVSLSSSAAAQTAPFDLAGPTIRVSITHDGVTLPIARVPQLAVGDRIDLKVDFPTDQAARYILVAGFLRGATNPPSDKWFHQAESWTKKGRKGLSLVVPEGAQQIVLFLAPATGGDFPTLRNAVQGRPGAFVRAAQDLAQASLDRRRLDAYLGAVRRPVPGDPERLERVTPLLARSLQIKVNTDCLSRTPELQAACLMQNQDALVLNDGHSNVITDALVGPGVGLAMQISATPQGGLGQYSPYIAAARDLIGIFSSLHTAKYQYIPALARLDGDAMNLVLNSAPSFHNPKSVMVAALPIVAPVTVPPLQPVQPQLSICSADREAVLPMVGAPLIYATDYAHDLKLRITGQDGRVIDIPARPDAERGGLVFAVDDRLRGAAEAPSVARLHGRWGFAAFEGPDVSLRLAGLGKWRAAAPVSASAPARLVLEGGTSACVSRVQARVNGRDGVVLPFKVAGTDTLTVDLPQGVSAASIKDLRVVGSSEEEAVEVALPQARPQSGMRVTLLAKNVDRQEGAAPVRLMLDGGDQVPTDAMLTASFQASPGQRFSGRETIEILAEGGSGASTRLDMSSGLTFADASIAILRMQPSQVLGNSAFGPLRARVRRDDVAGEWVSLGTLVRLPQIRQLSCAEGAAVCQLTGDRLYLLSAVAATDRFDPSVAVPEGFPGTAIQVPRPASDTLFVRLHDDPQAIARIRS